jgi:esterase/lipase superfamily enzyme
MWKSAMMSARVHGPILACVLLIAGCAESRQLMPTPNLYTDDKVALFEALPQEYASPLVELIYVTDRAPETDKDGNLRYGYNRSNSLAIGTTVVNLGHNVTWEDLVEASRTHTRIGGFELRLVSIDEFARLPPTPTPYKVIESKVVEDPEVVKVRKAQAARLRAEVKRRLALTPRKDVYLYVHGYNNSFEDATFALAELWHFLGREGLPIVYTWPAGYPGLFGYTYDRESSEFTVLHLKQVITWLSEQPEVENVHLIAHSRGTDVAISAFRELVIWARGAGINPRERFKVKNFVLVAPDLDVQVFSQRIAAEYLSLAVGQGTLYASPDDEAIGLAEWLFSSPRGRLGTLRITKLTEQEVRTMTENASRVSVVNFEGESTGYGHSYFRTNPAVSSDLVLMLRHGLKAGETGRPLEHVGLNFWRVPEGYPANAK